MPHFFQVARCRNGRWQASARSAAEEGEALDFGRAAAQLVGTDPVDHRVSRLAATVTATRRGWLLEPHNRNPVSLHLWAQPPRQLKRPETLTWPLIGLRFAGTEAEHWILLDDTESYTAFGRHTTGTTSTVELPRPLTPAQIEAVRAVFHDVLAWPPRPGARPDTVEAAARRLNRSRAAIDLRLREVRERAMELGLTREPAVPDPEYLYVLARAGYLVPDSADLAGWVPSSL